MTYLVTGGAGFIGSHLVTALLREGNRVRILDNFSTGRRDRIPADAECIDADITDLDTIRPAFHGVDGVFHIAALPVCLFFLLGAHLMMVQLQGMSRPLSVRSERAMPFIPNFLLRDLAAWSVMLGIVLALSAYYPATVGEKADPFAPTPAGIEPEWYFLWMFQTLKFFPGHILGLEGELVAIVAMGLAGLVLILVPWLDRPAARGQAHWLAWLAGFLTVFYMIGMTVYAKWFIARH